MIDDGISRQAIHEAAVRTRTMHRDGRRCAQCRPGGCDQLAWADLVLATLIRRPEVGRAMAILLRGVGR